ncbi:MAG: hypothetical protein V4726_06935 [Verrucomicrobiota bacterium]
MSAPGNRVTAAGVGGGGAGAAGETFYDEWRSLCGKPKDGKARLSNLMLTMEVNTGQFMGGPGPVSEVLA